MKRLISLFLVFAFCVTLMFGSWMPAQAASVEIDPLLTAKLQTTAKETEHTAILTFSAKPETGTIQLLQGLGLKTLSFRQLPMVAVRGPKAAIEQTFSLSGLRSVYSDKQLTYLLKESVPLIGADRVWQELGYTGKGVTVAVIDSGVDASHPDLPLGTKTVQNVKFLTGNLIFEGEPLYVENVLNSDTTSGHGTHVSGIIAGTGSASGGTYTGVAPGAQLVGLGTGETLSILWALEAFDYVLANQQKYNIQVISNSWGTTGAYSPNDPINVASKQAHDAGMVVAFAAGNEGPESNTLNPYSVASWVIGVAAGTKDRKLADFSSRGIEGDPLYYPTITAPGADIVSTRSSTGATINVLTAQKDTTYIPPQYLPYYTTASGTSMATPHIAGVVALMLEAKPGLAPDVVKDLLVRTADPMDGYKPFEVGAGYVNAYKAVSMAKSTNTQIGKYRDKKTGKTYPTYTVAGSWEGTVDASAAALGQESSDTHTYEIGPNAVRTTVGIEWSTPGTDLDLYVYGPDRNLAGSSAQGVTQSEETTITQPLRGTWSGEARGWLNKPEPYKGTYTIEYIVK